MKKLWHVNVVVETQVRANSAEQAAEIAERRIQRALDTRAASLNPVAGADYGDVSELEGQ